jgi:N-acetylmuramoyl-L-alanine amidase
MSSLSGSRHSKDLNARVNIINKSNAKLFLSIHMNCQLKNAGADGSYVLYSDKLPQNKALSYCIQRALNNIVIDGQKRTIHDPQIADFYVLRNAKVPGAIVEAAFLTNDRERELLLRDDFRETISKSIVNGIEQFLKYPNSLNNGGILINGKSL